MREKLNENPLYQAAVIGVLALVVGFMILTRMGGGGAEPPAADPAAVAPGTDPAAAAAAVPGTTPGGTAVSGTDPAAPAPAPSAASGGGGGEEFVAGPGLPKEVAKAYDDGKAVVLLIVRGNASDDRRVVPMVAALNRRSDTAVFLVKAFDIAKYSRIATGVDVDRTPALVVVQPKRLTEGPLPAASVSYGFRNRESVDQAVRDALYDGDENLPAYPVK